MEQAMNMRPSDHSKVSMKLDRAIAATTIQERDWKTAVCLLAIFIPFSILE